MAMVMPLAALEAMTRIFAVAHLVHGRGRTKQILPNFVLHSILFMVWQKYLSTLDRDDTISSSVVDLSEDIIPLS